MLQNNFEWITLNDQIDFMDSEGETLVTLLANKEYLAVKKGDKYIVSENDYEVEIQEADILREEN